MTIAPLVLRADADAQQGTGHVMRCLSLGLAWKRQGGKSLLVTCRIDSRLRQRAKQGGIQVKRIDAVPGGREDATTLVQWALSSGAKWVVVDGYHFPAHYQTLIRRHGIRVLRIDDYATSGRSSADLVLDQNVGLSSRCYPKGCSERQPLLGPRYALLRPEFWSRPPRRQFPAVARRFLITLGGGGHEKLLREILSSLSSTPLKDISVIVVRGILSGSKTPLRSSKGISLRTIENVQHMGPLMAWADIAIMAAGSTTYEAARLGLPALLVSVAPNQKSLARAMNKIGAAGDLGSSTTVSRRLCERLTRLSMDPHARKKMSQVSRGVVDGRGAIRVAKILLRDKGGTRS